MKQVGLNAPVPELAQAVRQLVNGHTNAIGTFTLAASATQTIVTDPNCSAGSHPVPVPTSSSAASSGWWIKAAADGAFTVGHVSSTATDRTFRYELRQG